MRKIIIIGVEQIMTTQDIERIIVEALWRNAMRGDTGIADVGTYRDAGMDVPGVIVKMDDGTQYQARIVRRC